MDGSTFGHHWSTAGPLRCLLKFIFLLLVCNSQAWSADFRRDLLFEFEAVEGATAYEIEVVREGRQLNKPQILRFQTATWKGKLRPGVYRVRLRSIDERGVAGDWSDGMELQVAHPPIPPIQPKPREQLKSEAPEFNLEVKFEDPSVVGFSAKLYRGTDLQRTDSFDSKAGQVVLSSGESYRLELTPSKRDSAPVEPTVHEILVQGPKLEAPEFLMPVDQDQEVHELVWREVRFSDETRLDWMRLDSRKVEATKIKESRLNLKKFPDGIYRFRATAMGLNRIPSPVTNWYVRVRSGRIVAQGASLADLNRARVKPNWNLGVFAGPLSERFDGRNSELGTRTKFSDSSGLTVQAEAETPSVWRNVSVWSRARVSHASYSGGQGPDFDVQLFNLSVDGRLRWRQTLWGEGSYFLSLGSGYEEVPEFVTARERPVFGAQFVQQIPLRFGFGFETRWSNQFSARAALTLVGGMTPVQVPRDGTLGEQNGGGELELGLGYRGFEAGVVEVRLEGMGREIEYRSQGSRNSLNYESTRILGGWSWEF